MINSNICSSNYIKPKNQLLRINHRQGEFLVRLAVPLTLPYTDLQGRVIQLWKIYSSLVASVYSDSEIFIISGNHISNPLQQVQNQKDLLDCLENKPIRRWQFSYTESTGKVVIWPFLKAAGKDTYHQSKIDECQNKLNEYNYQLRIGDPKDRRQAARRENLGEVLSVRSDGKPHDHVKKVKQVQNGLKNRISDLQRHLADPTLKGQKRQQAQRLLSQASSLLDESEKYVPSDSKKNLGFAAKQAAMLGKMGLTGAILMSSTLFGKTPATEQFRQTLQQTKLTESYKSSNPESTIGPKGVSNGQIGGVGNTTGIIQGLMSDPVSLMSGEHLFVMKGWRSPFSSLQLQQILRELAIGIYVHDTTPFFSLHFNQDASLFPVIHPAYEKTLVGRVIGMLDYIMKGYLNGGVYKDELVDGWAQHATSKGPSGLDKLILFEEYCQEKFSGADQEYAPLNKLILTSTFTEGEMERFKDDPSYFFDYGQFSNSFRIIAKQKQFQRAENLFLIDPDFEVEYTIAPDPGYERKLQEFVKEHGRYPLGYQALEKGCKKICTRIHDHMAQFPLCKEYFSMLGVINFFSSYFMTLKSHAMIPDLKPLRLPEKKQQACPALFPHLPVTQCADVDKVKPHLQEALSHFHDPENGRDGLERKKNRGALENYLIWRRNPVDSYVARLWCQEYSAAPTYNSEEGLKSLKELIPLLEKSLLLQMIPNLDPINIPSLSRQAKIKEVLQEGVSKMLEQIGLWHDSSVRNHLYGDELIPGIKEQWQSVSSLVGLFKTGHQNNSEYLLGLKRKYAKMFSKNESYFGRNRNYWLEKYPLAPSLSEKEIGMLWLTKPHSDLTYKESKTTRAVGGCGMDLQSQPIVFSPQAQEVLDTQWPFFCGVKDEGWNFAGDFRLCRLEVVPTFVGQNNYQWMENLIQVDYGKDVASVAPQTDKETVWVELAEVIESGGDKRTKESQKTSYKKAFHELVESIRVESLPQYLLTTVAKEECSSWENLHKTASYDAFKKYTEYLTNPDKVNAEESFLRKITITPNEKPHNVKTFILTMKHFIWMDAQTRSWLSVDRSQYFLKKEEGPDAVERYESYLEKRYQKFIEILSPFLDKGIEPPLPPLLDKNRCSLLHVSAQQSDPYFTKELLKVGVSVSASDIHGFLPLHYAAMSGHALQIQLLLEKAPTTIKTPSRFGATPLFVAIQHGQAKATKMLLEKGREKNLDLLISRLSGSYTPLISALHEGNLEILSEILPFLKSSHINAVTEQKVTPLMLACELKNIDLIESFIKMGADINAKDKSGYTALDIALKHQSLDIIGLLRKTALTPKLIDSIAHHADENAADILASEHHFLAPCEGKNVLTACIHTGNIPAFQKFLEPMLQKQILKPQEALAKSLLKKALQNNLDVLVKRLLNVGVQLDEAETLQLIQQTGSLHLLKYTLSNSPLSKERGVALFRAILISKEIALLPEFLKTLQTLPEESQEAILGPLKFTDHFIGWKRPHFFARMDASSFLLDHVDITRDCLERVEEDKGKTLAYIAAESGSLHSFEKLLDEMEDQGESFENQYGDRHLLYGAFDSFQQDIIDIALCYFQKDINISLETSTGVRAVHLAASQNNVDVLERLEEYRADFKARDREGYSALYYAIRSNSLEAVEFLIKRKCPITSRDVKKAQDLQENTPDLLNHLIKAGAPLPQKPEPVERKVPEIEEIEEKLKAFYVALEKAIEERDAAFLVEHLGEIPATYILPKGDVPFSFFLINLCRTFKIKNADLLMPFFKEAQETHPNFRDFEGNSIDHYLIQLDIDLHTYTLLPRGATLPEGIEEEKALRFNPHMQNEKGITPLHIAAKSSPHKTFKKVLDSCSIEDLEIEDFKGNTPLFYAVETGKNVYVRQLLEKGVNPDHRNHCQLTPAFYAVTHKKTEALRTLLDFCEIEKYLSTQTQKITLLHYLAQEYPEDIFLEALEKTPKPTYSEDRRKGIAQILADNGSLKALRFLAYKDKEAVISADQHGYPWDRAALKGNIEILRFYKNILPKLFTKEHGGKGENLLVCAAKSGQSKAAEWILDQGLLKHLKRTTHIEILKRASISNSNETLSLFTDIFIEGKGKYAEDGDYFLMEGALEALNQATQNDSTNSLNHFYNELEFPIGWDLKTGIFNEANGIQIATQAGALKSAQWLLQNGADLHKTNGNHQIKALELAAGQKSVSQFQYLLENLSDEELETYFKSGGESQTLLHIAAIHGHVDHVALLLDRGVNLNIRDEYGLTALERAIVERRADVALLLMLCGADHSSIVQAKGVLEKTLSTKLEKTLEDYKETNTMVKDLDAVFNSRSHGESPLHLAIKLHHGYSQNKNPSLLKSAKLAVLLLSKTDQLQSADTAGNTPLHLAALLGDLSSARILIKNGADLEAENNEEATPESLAIEGGSLAMRQFLDAFNI